MSTSTISARDLAGRLRAKAEICLLDVREEGDYARGHLFHARCIPLSVLELLAEVRIPRKNTEIVLCDDGSGIGSGLMEAAAVLMAGLGYDSVRRLGGAYPEWEQAGFLLYEGIYVPSKAFGEFVENALDTPGLDPHELAALMDGNPGIKVFDCRPLAEYRRMSIPGAINCPGGELVERLAGLTRSPDTPIVVNCAGRTRSIIGTQTLINAGFPNRVMALRNGTMGWELAGYRVDHGETRQVPAPDPEDAHAARTLAVAWRNRERLRAVSWDDVCQMRADPNVTTYLFDVRDPEEQAAGSLPGAVAAPAGQLVQTTDIYAATLGARLVLFDDHGTRNTMAASWLARAGWTEVYLLDEGPIGALPMPDEGRFDALVPDEARLTVGELDDAIRGGASFIDLSTSQQFFAGHVPGARFGIRSRLLADLRSAGIRGPLVLMARERTRACLGYRTLLSEWPDPILVLFSDSASWPEVTGALEEGFEGALSPPLDMWHTPSSPLGGGRPAMSEYIRWETGLLEKAANEPGIDYKELAKP